MKNYRNETTYKYVVEFKNLLGESFFDLNFKGYDYRFVLQKLVRALRVLEHSNAKMALSIIAVFSNCGFSGWDGYIEDFSMPSTRDCQNSIRYARKVLNRKAPLKVSFYDEQSKTLRTCSIYL